MIDNILVSHDIAIENVVRILEAELLTLNETSLESELKNQYTQQIRTVANKVKVANNAESMKRAQEDEFRQKKFAEFEQSTGIRVDVVKAIVEREAQANVSLNDLMQTCMDELKIYFKQKQVLHDIIGVSIWVIAYFAITLTLSPMVSTAIIQSGISNRLVVGICIELMQQIAFVPVVNFITERLSGFRDDEGVISDLIQLRRDFVRGFAFIPTIITTIIPIINIVINKVKYIYDKTSITRTGAIDPKKGETLELIKNFMNVIYGVFKIITLRSKSNVAMGNNR